MSGGSISVTTTETKSITVATDAVSIYEGGNLITVGIPDLLNNEVAVRQLINDYNQTKRRNRELADEVQRLNIERAGLSLQPFLLSVNAVFALGGALLVGLGTNYLSQSNPPAASGWILGVGAVFSLVSAIVPILLPLVIANRAKKSVNAT